MNIWEDLEQKNDDWNCLRKLNIAKLVRNMDWRIINEPCGIYMGPFLFRHVKNKPKKPCFGQGNNCLLTGNGM